jgi:hypothetical protein
MGTAHGAEELGLCSHGLACPGRRLGPLHRVLPRKIMENAIFGQIKIKEGRQKYLWIVSYG